MKAWPPNHRQGELPRPRRAVGFSPIATMNRAARGFSLASPAGVGRGEEALVPLRVLRFMERYGAGHPAGVCSCAGAWRCYKPVTPLGFLHTLARGTQPGGPALDANQELAGEERRPKPEDFQMLSSAIILDRNSRICFHKCMETGALPKSNRARCRARRFGLTTCWT
jgi:hypothetical protein